jgi:hypothetical protein
MAKLLTHYLAISAIRAFCLARGTTLPLGLGPIFYKRNECRHTGRATDTPQYRFTGSNVATLPKGIRSETVRANYLLGLHYLNHSSSGHHLLLAKDALIMASLGFRAPSRRVENRSTRAQRPGILAERRRELEKHDSKAEMNLHG